MILDKFKKLEERQADFEVRLQQPIILPTHEAQNITTAAVGNPTGKQTESETAFESRGSEPGVNFH